MSYDPNLDISEKVWPSSTILHEIEWCEKRIIELQPKLVRRPRTIKEIRDLQRQIEDKRKVLNKRAQSVCT